MIEPPPSARTARFGTQFGQRVLLTIDTEEEFDWRAPFTRDRHGLSHVEAIQRFQLFCEGLGAHPVYLVDWPIVQDARAVEIIGDAVRRGMADIGVQLHPWVNPPFDEEVSVSNSYAGNLPRELEAAKFRVLRDAIEQAFDTAPQIYRAGRYGLGENSAQILKDNGIRIDTSVRSLFDYRSQSGPDYSNHPLAPYWIDEAQDLLELPLTTVYWGVLRQLGRHIQRLQPRMPMLYGSLSKLHLLERIALTPEGVTAEEAIRGIDIALDDGLPLLVLSFHSPSLAPGLTPYVETEAEVEQLYDWLARIYTYLDTRGVRSASVADIIAASL
ncbi:MAG: polysaccharide deacetylase family protein [Erythrobacter sp.]